MHIRANGYDELQAKVMAKLLASKTTASPKKGPILELPGVILELTNPRIRLSRTESRQLLFSCLGELIWYLSVQDDLDTIRYYIPKYPDIADNGKVRGAYGPRLFNMHGHDQVRHILAKLRADPDSRQAVIQVFDASDIAGVYKDVPCTCVLQFLIRDQCLHMITYMRSNDVFLGLPHDIFSFTMLQEIVARSLGYELGTYKHMVGSLHLYKKDMIKAQKVLSDGYPQLLPMPPMPPGDPWPAIDQLLVAARAIRLGEEPTIGELDPYWLDLITLLNIYTRLSKQRDRPAVQMLKSQLHTIYQIYVDNKLRKTEKRAMYRSKSKKVEQARLNL